MAIDVIGKQLSILESEINKSPKNVLSELESYSAFVDDNDLNTKARFQLTKARALFRLGETDEAEKLFLDVLKIDTENSFNSAMAYGFLSKLMHYKKQFDRAILYARQNVMLTANETSLSVLLNALFGYYWQKKTTISTRDKDEIVEEIEQCFTKIDAISVSAPQKQYFENLRLDLEIMKGNLRVTFPKLEKKFENSEKPHARLYVLLINTALEIGLLDKVQYYLELAIRNKVVRPSGMWFGLGETLRKAEAFNLAKDVFMAIGFGHPDQCLHHALCSLGTHDFKSAIEKLQMAQKLLTEKKKFPEKVIAKYNSFVLSCYEKMTKDSKRVPSELTSMARESAKEILTQDASKTSDSRAFKGAQSIAREYFTEH